MASDNGLVLNVTPLIACISSFFLKVPVLSASPFLAMLDTVITSNGSSVPEIVNPRA